MNSQVIKRIRKVFIYTLTGVSFVLVSAFLILQIPTIQEILIKRYLGSFSKVTNFKTTIEGFQLLWFDRLELRNINIYDPAENRMIGAETIIINFKLAQLFKQQDINIDGITLDNAHVFLTKIAETDTSTNLNINVFVHQINEHYAGEGGGASPKIHIGEAILNQSRFYYVDQFKDSIHYGFNYNHFNVAVEEAQLKNFLIQGDTTQFHVKSLLATDEKTKFHINQLSTFFRLSQRSMEFIGLDLQAGESVVSDTIIFTFNGQDELSEFVSKVNIHANLQNTIIQPKDLALFAPAANQLTQPLFVNGIFNGRINNFKLTNMDVGTGKTSLRGALDMEGLPDITETFIILDLKDSRLDFQDLSFLFKEQTLKRFTPLGRVSLDGQFLGYPTDFVAKGHFTGKLGHITSDINFKVNEKDFDKSIYSGKLGLTDFELGQYLQDTVNFQQVNLSGDLRGSGVTLQTADFLLNGKVNSIGIRNYNYTNITTNARFASELFNGLFIIDDPNLQFTAKGSVDLRKNNNLIKIHAQIDTAFLDKLKLTDKTIFLHTDIDINSKGLHIDSLAGTADLKNFQLQYNNTWLTLEDIIVKAERTNSERILKLQTTLADAEVKGNFLLSDLSKDIQKLIHEFLLNIKNDKIAIAEYYQSKNYKPKSYQADFNVLIKNIKPIIKLTNIDLLVSDQTAFEGKFTSGYTTILQAYTRFDSIAYNKTLLLNADVEFTASKIADSTNVLAMAFLTSDRQTITPELRTKDLIAEAIWNNNHINFGVDADQDGQPNYMRLKGTVDFLNDSTLIKVLPSTLKILDNTWSFDDRNLIALHHNEIIVNTLRLNNNDQYIIANGVLSPDPEKKLSLQVNNFNLSMLKPVLGRDISGTLNAWFNIHNYFSNPYVQNDVRIDSLSVDKFLIGDITGKNQWDTLENKFIINFFIDRHNKRIVNVDGFYNPSRETSPLDVTARLETANLKILEPFLEDLFSNISGTVTGDYRITGKLNAPAIQGEGKVQQGQLMINYLKTSYQFNGIVGLSPNSIYFKDIDLRDMFNNIANLNGTIAHQNFYSMRINIDASFQNFQVLNTTAKDNTLFYGQGYASGDLSILGPVTNLKITANARTDKNTKIYIPLGEVSESGKKEFIKFVSFKDSTFQQSLRDQINNKLDLTGVTMDFNLDVTPDAYCEILIGGKTGDLIKGRGNGDLQLQLDTKGAFNMFGPFEFTQGTYTFNFYDLFSKGFEIQKGSLITWYGDAYTGNLNIIATYNQNVSFEPIFPRDENTATPPQLRRKYPVQVLSKLEGPMSKPDIKLDIVAPDLPQIIIEDGRQNQRLDFQFQLFKNKLDEQELYRQVFSLLVFRRFSPTESFNTSGSLVNSVSELLSNQLSTWVNQLDENLEIDVDVDLSTMNEEQVNTFQLRLAYTLLGGRLRISRDGTFYANQNNSNQNAAQTNLSGIAGDWTVEYLLTPDGKLKIKMYNRTNVNSTLTSALGSSQNSVTAGASLTYTKSFNELKDLWREARKRKKNPSEEPPPDVNKEAIKNEEDGTE
jgi:hypothetical protein